jgi:hypothetical protein
MVDQLSTPKHLTKVYKIPNYFLSADPKLSPPNIWKSIAHALAVLAL